MANEDTQNPAASAGEPSPAEKLAQPTPHASTDADQATRTESGDTSADTQSSAKPRIKPQGGVPVAKLSGIGIPVTVMLFILAFLWKGAVFALGVLAAIALALAVIWAVRSIASRPDRTPRSAPAPRRAAVHPAGGPRSPAASHRPRQAGSNPRSRSDQRRSNGGNGGNQAAKPKLMDRLRPNRKPDDRTQVKPKPGTPGDKSRSAATPPGKGKPPAAGKPGSSTKPGGAGTPGRPLAKTTPGATSKPGSKPSGSKPSTSKPSGSASKPHGSKPSGSGSSGAKPSGGGKSTPKPRPAASQPGAGSKKPASTPQPAKGKTSGGTRDRSEPKTNGTKTRGAADGAASGGGKNTTPNTSPVAEKPRTPETKKARNARKAKQKKTANAAPQRTTKPLTPVDPRNQWIVQPGAKVQQPNDPTMQALADRVRAAGGATPAPPGVASLEDKRHRNLGDAIRKAGQTPVQQGKQRATGPASNKNDYERFNAVYGQMIDLSSPESKAHTLTEVAETARRDQLRLADQAGEMRSTAAALPEKGYEEVKSNLLTRAAELEEDAETRGHWSVAAADRAEQFAAEANGLAI